LKLCNTVDDDTVRAALCDRAQCPALTRDLQVGASAYNLFAVVVHVGSGPNHGACCVDVRVL